MQERKVAEWRRDPYWIRTDRDRLQVERIHAFLTRAYWCEGIPRETVERAVAASLCFGLYERTAADEQQVGFARVVTDAATFAWLCDVYVEADHRGRGLATWLVGCVLAHPALQGLRRICLTTRDAHGVYEKLGFKLTATPGFWMEIKDDAIYRRPSPSQ
jgi:GNAT superfamily N-acetyltransferase